MPFGEGLLASPDATLRCMLDIIAGSSDTVVEKALISKNREVNEFLLKLFVSHKYNAIQVNADDATNNLNNANAVSNPRQLLHSLTGMKFPENSKLEGKKTRDSQNNEMPAIWRKEIKIKINYFELISDDSWINILCFLSEKDLLASAVDTSHLSLHCVSKNFNKLLKKILSTDIKYNSNNGNEMIKKFQLRFDECYWMNINKIYQKFHKSVYNYSFDFQMPNGIVKKVRIKNYPYPLQKDKTKQVILEIETDYSRDSTARARHRSTRYDYDSDDSDDTRESSDSDDSHDSDKEMKIEINSKILYQNCKVFDFLNDKNERGMDDDKAAQVALPSVFPLCKTTQTSFAKHKTLSTRMNIYNKNNNGQLKTIESQFGNRQFKLVDINLYGLYNYYIYNQKQDKTFGDLSIAEMVFKFTKRQWRVGIIDIDKLKTNNGNQIRFSIDITEEVMATMEYLAKKENCDKTQLLGSFSRNKYIGIEKHKMKSGKIYYCFNCYCQWDNKRIIHAFGTFTSKEDHCKIWDLKYQRRKLECNCRNGTYDVLASLRKVRLFNFDIMYKYFNKNEKCKNLINLNPLSSDKNHKHFEYLLVDFIGKRGHWVCGIVMKLDLPSDESKIEESDFYHSKEELLTNGAYYGQVTLLSFVHCFLSREKKRRFEKHHLDARNVAYFGQKTHLDNQFELLATMCDANQKFEKMSAQFRNQKFAQIE